MARPETLIAGNCYFSVEFYDKDLLLPKIDTLVYVGQENVQDEGRLWRFKEPQSPRDSDDKDASSEPPALIAFADAQLHEIVDFNGLVQILREIAVDHPLTPATQTIAEPPSVEDFESVPAKVARFLDDPEIVSLTIQFTDGGLSLGRREGGYEMHLFAHPRRDPLEDTRILSFFAGIGVQPLVDYFFDRGRTRHLEFPIPAERDSMVDLCRRVLTEVYSMRRGDVLDYHFLKKADIERPSAHDGP